MKIMKLLFVILIMLVFPFNTFAIKDSDSNIPKNIVLKGAPIPYSDSYRDVLMFSDGTPSYIVTYTLSGTYERCGSGTNRYICNIDTKYTVDVNDFGAPHNYGASKINDKAIYTVNGSKMDVIIKVYVDLYKNGIVTNNVELSHTFVLS